MSENAKTPNNRNPRGPIGAAILVASAILVLLVLWQISHVALAFFGAILFAVFLDSATWLIRGATSMPRNLSLAVVLILMVAAVAGFSWFVGPRIEGQLSELGTRIPAAMDHIGSRLRQAPWGAALLATVPSLEQIVSSSGGILGPVSGFFSTTLGAITNTVLIIVAGVYLAIEPAPYVRGVARLVPAERRGQAKQLLNAVARALRWWLLGRLASMAAVGILTAAGLWLIGMPAILALALIAAVLSFVPYLGPLLAVIPALLVAFVDDPLQVVYVVLVYSAVQFLEGNLVTPLIQERTVSLLPAVLLTVQIGLGVMFGIMGVLLAAPLAVVAITAMQILYVRDTLDERIPVLGQHDGRF